MSRSMFPSRFAGLLTLFLLSGASFAGPASERSDRPVDFEKQVRPIFAAKCLGCHGPGKQESQFRLDRKSIAMKGGDFGEPAIVPGKSQESLLFRFIAGLDPNVRMPPEGERLLASEIETIQRWIDQGAAWPEDDDQPEDLRTDHWSFRPIGRPVPPVADAWSTTPVDAFVLNKLRAEGLEPSPPAQRRTLIRRLYLVLLGLPPTPEEVADFANDHRPDAYSRLIDRALASPRYGERWARHWLDVVRFAETNGFEMNQERPTAYHYRDYVVRAFNDDKPFDRFTLEQLAGDTVGEDAATGFLVAGAWDQVKSPDLGLTLMQRQDELADIINTTGTTFLGLTLGCARCHSHKFDPIPQTDYYELQAVFAGVQHGERELPFTDRTSIQAADALQARLDALTGQLDALRATANAGRPPAPLREPVNAVSNEERFEPVETRAIRFTVLATNNGSEPCLDELEAYADDKIESNVFRAEPGLRVRSSGDYAGNPRHRIEHINDGRHGNDYSWISNEPGRGWIEVELSRPMRIGRVVWGRDRNRQFSDRLPTQYVIEVTTPSGERRAVASSTGRLPLPGADPTKQFPGLAPEKAKRAAELLLEIEATKARRSELVRAPMAYAGRFAEPAPTRRLYRGDPMQPREQVGPGALEVLEPRLGSLKLSAGASEHARRLALARWMIHPDNPLTARVIANRVWQWHFGAGLVGTSSDFGKMGVAPSHPELLDWLARELIGSGWSLKHLHRVILLSNTFQQSSRPTERGLAVDSGSRWLWRYPPRRLEAEAIRDSVLTVCGTLNSTMYGPGYAVFKPNSNYVRVYEPKEEWGPPEWRRMVYMHKVRMEQDVVFGVFDCPDAGQTAPKRNQSTTALQALSLFNSSFMFEQARYLAARLEREAGSDAREQLNRAFQLAFGREALPTEIEAAQELIRHHGIDAFCRALLNSNEFLFVP